MVEQVQLPHVPDELAVYIACYRNVSNAAFLRQQLLAGNQDFEYAFIDASMVGHMSSKPTSLAENHGRSSPGDRSWLLPFEQSMICYMTD
jgi:hypothetical protein